MNKKYAIFDMDGTLVDSMVFWRRLAREYLAGKGIHQPMDELMERIKTMTMTESAALFIEEFGLCGTPESVAAEMNAMMEAHYRDDIPLKSGVLEYVSHLSGMGVRMCVASATKRELMETCLQRLKIAGFFDFLLSCEEVGAGKNRPDIFLCAARQLGAQPCEIAVYEDASFAVETARSAGFYTIAVYDDSEKNKWEKLTATADEAISDWTEAVQTL